MKVAGHRLPWNQGKQDGTDREIYEGKFDKGFQREPPVKKASLYGTSVDEFRTWYTVKSAATQCRGRNLTLEPVFARPLRR